MQLVLLTETVDDDVDDDFNDFLENPIPTLPSPQKKIAKRRNTVCVRPKRSIDEKLNQPTRKATRASLAPIKEIRLNLKASKSGQTSPLVLSTPKSSGMYIFIKKIISIF